MVGAVVVAAAVGSARLHGSENSRDLHYAAGCGGLTGMAMRGLRLLLEEMTGRLAVITVAVLCCPIAVNAQENGVRRALLIGVGDYLVNEPESSASSGVAPLSDLQGPPNDVRLLARVLTTRFGFDAGDIVTLVDSQASRQAVIAALENIVADAGPEDIVYIHFSGYGATVKDQNGDEADGWDDSLLAYDARTEGVADITDDELHEILLRLKTPKALVVLDAGHTPMPTVKDSDVVVRAAGQDSRVDLYANTDGGSVAHTQAGQYILIGGAVPGQFALDARISGERWFGWFSWSFAHALSRGDRGESAWQIHQRAQRVMDGLGDRLGLRSAAALLRAPPGTGDRPLLGGDELRSGSGNAASRAWAAVRPLEGGSAMLEQGSILGGSPGSVWAIYAPGTTEFARSEILATAEVTGERGYDAIVRIDGGESVPESSRAILLAPAPPALPPKVVVWAHRVAPELRSAMQAEVGARARGWVEFAESGRGARFVVNLDDRGCRVYGPGGLQQIARFEATDLTDTWARLAHLFERSAKLAHLQALDNPSGTIALDVRVVPIDVDGMPRLQRVPGAQDIPTFRVREPGEPRAPDNSLLLRIRAGQDAYITVVDVGPDGSVVPLFPNPVSEQRDFYRDGRIPGGQEIRIPDSLTSGSAGFFIDYEPPLGHDTLRVFAARDLLTAERIRDYLARYVAWTEGEGALPDFAEPFLPIEGGQDENVGTALTGFGLPAGASQMPSMIVGDWSASSVSFSIRD
ncbi:MAG: caspase family protein [Gammaproteobacteria bacterium]|nr:MAG: caspase family protein [Gammaproteobacteria bacterium]